MTRAAALRRQHRILLAAGLLAAVAPLVSPAAIAHAQSALSASSQSGGTVVIAAPQYANVPIPTLMEGPAAHTANFDVADQLFLRLAMPKPGRSTADESAFTPLLARSWARRDS